MFPESLHPTENPVRSISEKQLEANRRNARKSTGPRTEGGKSRSSLNALRHGLTAHVTVMTFAQREAHDLYVSELIANLKPIGALEYSFADSIAEDGWRLKRARALEENIYALGHPDLTAVAELSVDALGHPDLTAVAELSVDAPGDADPEQAVALAHARSFMAQPKNLQLLTLYESRLHRSHQRSLAQLRELQAERKAAYDKAFEEAQLLAQLAEHEGTEYDPAEDFPPENGFVFSIAEIRTALGRKRRLLQARMHSKGGWNPACSLPKAA